MSSSSQPAPPNAPASAYVPVTAIVALVAKGLTASAILEVFPDLKPEDIRSALLTAVDTVCDQHAALPTGDSVDAMIAQAQQSSGLSDEAAMELAVSETRALRRERAVGLT
jgi:hypothetical protein